jgi:phosphoglycolate phosphatase
LIILFDLDGTLIDSTEAILSSFHHTFKIYGLTSPQDEEIKKLIGYPLDIMYKELGVDEDKVWDFVDAYKEQYRQISTQQTILLDFAKDAIVKADSFATIGVVTTKTARYSKILLEYFGLSDYFKVLIGREDVIKPKPDAEPILKALDSLNSYDKDVWMIGDTKLDLISANNAKVESIGVLCGYGDKDNLKEYTNHIFKNSLEAVNFLEKKLQNNT